ncbi:MAG: VWA domain-containing protein [Anaerolineae bacterium]
MVEKRCLLQYAVAWAALLLLLWLGLAIACGGAREVSDGNLRRRAASGLAYCGTPLPVRLTLGCTHLPYCPQPVQPPVDLLLVLDRSGSMQGQPMAEAKRAIEALLANLDRRVHRAGLLAFNDTPVLVSPPSQDVEGLRRAMDGLEADGGTDLAGALTAALSSLGEVPAKKVAIVLTDGQTADPPAVAAGARSLEAAGVQVIAVGFVSPEYRPDVLAGIASSPDDLFAVADPRQFEAIFRRISLMLNAPVGYDLQVRESLNTDAFQPHGPLAARINAAGGSTLPWSSTIIPSTGMGLTYELMPRRLGRQLLSPEGAIYSLLTCDGQPLAGNVIRGPYVLVLPHWLLLLLLALLPLLAALVFCLRPEKVARPAFDVGLLWAGEHSGFTDRAVPLADDKALDPPKSRGDAASCRPALIVGAGQEGRDLITLLKSNLLSRYRAIPNQIRMLAVDFQAPGRAAPRDFPNAPHACRPGPQESLLLAVNSNADGEHHCRKIGFAEKAWHGPSRARARAMLHYDWSTAGADGGNSRLAMALRDLADGLQAAEVYIAVPAGDETSGWLADLPRLIHRVLQNQAQHMTLLLLPAGPSRQSTGQQDAANQVSSLIELSRLGLPGCDWHSIYGPETEAATQSQVYVANYVHQALATLLPELRAGQRLQASDPRQGAMVGVADWLACVLSGDDLTLTQDRQTMEGKRQTSSRSFHRYLLAGVGCEYWRFPVYGAQEVYLAQLLRNAFGASGLLPAGELASADDVVLDDWLSPELGAPWHRLLDIALREDEARTTASEQYVFEHDSLQRLVENAGDVLGAALERALERLLASDADVRLGPARALALLDALSRRLERTHRILLGAGKAQAPSPSSGVAYGELTEDERRPLAEWYKGAFAEVKAAQEAIKAWSDAWPLLEKQAQDAWRTAKQAYDWQRGFSGVQAAGDQSLWAKVDALLSRPDTTGLLARWRWRWDRQQGGLVLQGFGLVPEDSSAAPPRKARARVFGPQETAHIWCLARDQAEFYSRVVLDWPYWKIRRRWHQVSDAQLQAVVKALVENASPLSDFDNAAVNQLLPMPAGQVGAAAVEISWRLLAPAADTGEPRLEERISAPALRARHDWADPHGAALLSYAEQIPAEALGVWRDHIGEVRSEDLLFAPERVARKLDEEAPQLVRAVEESGLVWEGQSAGEMLTTCRGRPLVPPPNPFEPILHPEFGAWLLDEQRAELFAQAFLHGLVTADSGQWVLKAADQTVALGTGLLEAFQAFNRAPDGFVASPLQDSRLARTLAALHEEIGQQRQQVVPDARRRDMLERLRQVRTLAENDLVGERRMLWSSLRNWLTVCALRSLQAGARGSGT